jgi:hypothetical protein
MSIRADFEAAIEANSVEEETPEVSTPEIEALDNSPVEEVPSEETESETEAEAEGSLQETADASEPASEEPEGTTAEAEPRPKTKDSMKAPINWSPKEREDWSRIPRHLQERIVSRETEMAQVMANTKAARTVHDAITNMTQQYGQLMQAEGATDPLQAIDGMFKTVQTLRTAPQRERATLLASMIEHYGVDIRELDDALSNSPSVAADPVQTKLEQMLEQRLAPVNQLMQGLTAAQQKAQEQTRHQATQSVQEFSQQAEFLNDVRLDMADLIDMAAAQGRELPLAKAYEIACAANPDIAKIMADRKQRESLIGNQQTLAQKRNAASSLSGRKSGGGGDSSNMDLRAMLSSAWDEAG